MNTFEPSIEFGIQLAYDIAEAVKPVYGIKQLNVPIGIMSGDFQYAVDDVAEQLITKEYHNQWKAGNMYGFITEDQGLVVPEGTVTSIALIDPVDGSRPAQSGAEQACVTMAIVKGDNKNATFDDIHAGVTYAIKEGKMFVTVKGQGVWEITNGKRQKVEKRETPQELKNASMVYEHYGTNLAYIGQVLDPLLRQTHFASAYPSGAYQALSLVRGQNDLHIDIRRRLIDDFPNLPIAYKLPPKVLAPMDIVAGYLMINELGGKITDAYGKPLNDKRLWQFDKQGNWSANNQISWIAAASSILHQQTLEFVEKGFAGISK